LAASIDLGPESLDANVGMQLLELYRGSEAEALEHARTALALDPLMSSDVGALEFLRDHALAMGRSLEAKALYRTGYPELFGDDPAVDRRNYRAAID